MRRIIEEGLNMNDTTTTAKNLQEEIPRENGKFIKGYSGNPAGRVRGSKNTVTKLAENLLEDNAEKIASKAVELALKGDTVCIKLVLDKLLPTKRERDLNLQLPQIKSASDLVLLQAHIIESVARGDLSASEGKALTEMVLQMKQTYELETLEKKLQKLEEYVGK